MKIISVVPYPGFLYSTLPASSSNRILDDWLHWDVICVCWVFEALQIIIHFIWNGMCVTVAEEYQYSVYFIHTNKILNWYSKKTFLQNSPSLRNYELPSKGGLFFGQSHIPSVWTQLNIYIHRQKNLSSPPSCIFSTYSGCNFPHRKRPSSRSISLHMVTRGMNCRD